MALSPALEVSGAGLAAAKSRVTCDHPAGIIQYDLVPG